MSVSSVLPFVLVPVLGWRLYSRYKKLTGRQTPHLRRLWTAVILFPMMLALVAFAAHADNVALASLTLGGLAGVGLAHWGLKLTRFESDDNGLFYVPNSAIGLGLMALFTGRIIYRLVQMSGTNGFQAPAAPPQVLWQPSTTLILGIIFCYYVYYSVGILRWRKAQLSKGESQ